MSGVLKTCGNLTIHQITYHIARGIFRCGNESGHLKNGGGAIAMRLLPRMGLGSCGEGGGISYRRRDKQSAQRTNQRQQIVHKMKLSTLTNIANAFNISPTEKFRMSMFQCCHWPQTPSLLEGASVDTLKMSMLLWWLGSTCDVQQKAANTKSGRWKLYVGKEFTQEDPTAYFILHRRQQNAAMRWPITELDVLAERKITILPTLNERVPRLNICLQCSVYYQNQWNPLKGGLQRTGPVFLFCYLIMSPGGLVSWRWAAKACNFHLERPFL